MSEERLAASCSDDDQTDTAEQGNGADDGRDKQGVLGLVGDLNGAEVDVLLLVGEGESAGGESNDAEEDEKNSDDGGWLHGWEPFLLGSLAHSLADVMRILL